MAENQNGGAFLTDKRSRFLAGEDVFADLATAKQTRYNHRKRIREQSKSAVYDFQHLFNHLPQSELLDESAFAEGADADAGPVSRVRHDGNYGGRVPDHYVGDENSPHAGEKVDPAENADSQHKLEQLLEEMNAPRKASPETQEALIDAVAFLCRAAEAGELKIPEVLEQGFERYHEDREERNPNSSKKVVKVTEREYGATYTKARTRERQGEAEDLTSIEKKVMRMESDGE